MNLSEVKRPLRRLRQRWEENIKMNLSEVKRPLRRLRQRWEENIKMNLSEVGCDAGG